MSELVDWLRSEAELARHPENEGDEERATRLTEAAGIIDRLPVDGDGKPIAPGMTVWIRLHGQIVRAIVYRIGHERDGETRIVSCLCYGAHCRCTPGQCYSTEAAARRR